MSLGRFKRPVQLLSVAAIVVAGIGMMPSEQVSALLPGVGSGGTQAETSQAPVAPVKDVQPKVVEPVRVAAVEPVIAVPSATSDAVGPVADAGWRQWIRPSSASALEDYAARVNVTIRDLVPANATEVAAAAPESAVKVGSSRLNVREAPSTSATRLFVLQPGQPVAVLGTEEGWVRIQNTDGQTGWVHAGYLVGPNLPQVEVAKVEPREEPKPRTVAKVEPRAEPKAEPKAEPRVVAKVEAEPEPRAERRSRSTASAELRDEMSRSRVRGKAARLGEDVVLRSSPSRTGERVLRLPAGERVLIAESDGGWVRVVTQDGYSGWVRAQ